MADTDDQNSDSDYSEFCFADSADPSNDAKPETKKIPKEERLKSDQTAKSSTTEYFNTLEKWVQDMTVLQYVNYMAYNSFLSNFIISDPQARNRIPSVPRRTSRRPVIPRVPVSGIECRLPPIWKRVLAEFIDFACLFVVKLIATFILVDFLDIIDWNKYDFETLVQKTWKMDYNAAVELTSELMIVEFAHRITVCIFESFWLRHGFRGVVGGATPGKRLMHLRVVYCESITTIRTEPDLVVLIEPGSNLGIFRASIRSFVKNFILAFFLPFSFTFLYFQYNRTCHDVLARSVVIEEPVRYTSR